MTLSICVLTALLCACEVSVKVVSCLCISFIVCYRRLL
ncbi:hypothetical protein KP509_1Z006000 [Ceratopteris richardii]|nr:hypothetical protein KP509_1Z006000 [Ceratopteris richardii]